MFRGKLKLERSFPVTANKDSWLLIKGRDWKSTNPFGDKFENNLSADLEKEIITKAIDEYFKIYNSEIPKELNISLKSFYYTYEGSGDYTLKSFEDEIRDYSESLRVLAHLKRYKFKINTKFQYPVLSVSLDRNNESRKVSVAIMNGFGQGQGKQFMYFIENGKVEVKFLSMLIY